MEPTPILIFLMLCIDFPNPSSSSVQLRGAGASFPGKVYQAWVKQYEAFRKKYIDLSVTYMSVGSGTGIELIKSGDNMVEYTGSDILLTEADYAKHQELQMFPTLAG